MGVGAGGGRGGGNEVGDGEDHGGIDCRGQPSDNHHCQEVIYQRDIACPETGRDTGM